MRPQSPQSSVLPPPLEVRGLTVDFRGGVRAVANVSLKIDARDTLVVLGPSGAGKSTLLRCLNRLSTPTAGNVLHHGRDVTHVTGARLRLLRGKVGMIFQQFNLVGRLSVFENVLAGRLAHTKGASRWMLSHARWFPERDAEIALESLRGVGIANIADQRADTLSGGQQQRVAIARVLAQRPDAILADEPIASLDPRSAEVVLDTLGEIRATREIPVVINLHQIDHARRHATRIVGMNAGSVAFDAPPDEFDGDAVRTLYQSRDAAEVSPKTRATVRTPVADALA